MSYGTSSALSPNSASLSRTYSATFFPCGVPATCGSSVRARSQARSCSGVGVVSSSVSALRSASRLPAKKPSRGRGASPPAGSPAPAGETPAARKSVVKRSAPRAVKPRISADRVMPFLRMSFCGAPSGREGSTKSGAVLGVPEEPAPRRPVVLFPALGHALDVVVGDVHVNQVDLAVPPVAGERQDEDRVGVLLRPVVRAPGLDDQTLRDDRDDPAGQPAVEGAELAAGPRRDLRRLAGHGGVARGVEVRVEQLFGRRGESHGLLDRLRHEPSAKPENDGVETRLSASGPDG